MAEDEAPSSALSAAVCDLGRQLAAAIRAATGAAVVLVSSYVLGAVLVLTAIAVSTAIGIIALVRALHALLLLLVGRGWIADLVIGILLIAWPLALVAILRRRALPRSAPAPAPAQAPHRPARTAQP